MTRTDKEVKTRSKVNQLFLQTNTHILTTKDALVFGAKNAKLHSRMNLKRKCVAERSGLCRRGERRRRRRHCTVGAVLAERFGPGDL